MDRFFDMLLNPTLLVVLASGMATLAALVGLALPYLRPDPMKARLRVVAERRRDLREQALAVPQVRTLRRAQPNRLRALVEGLRPAAVFLGPEVRVRLTRAGWRGGNAPAIYLAARLGAPIILAGLVTLVVYGADRAESPGLGAALFGLAVAAFGFYLPPILVANAIQRRQAMITTFYPDALDLLLICVESGASLDAAFGRVAQELGHASPVLAEEFELTTAELTYLPDRRQALENFASRTGVPAVRGVVTALVQSEKYGTPTSTALATAAQESREARMAAAEKKASALPAQLTVPMIVFFLPVLFIVILGPAIIQVLNQ